MSPIKLIRQHKGISQIELSKKANINLRHLQNLEQRRRDINGCHLGTLIDIANALDCKVTDLLTDTKLKDAVNKHFNR